MRRLSQPPRDPAFVQDPYPFYDARPGRRAAVPVGGLRAALRRRATTRWRRSCATAASAASRPRTCGPPGRRISPNFYALDDLSMLDREPPAHTRLRGLVLRAFTSRRIAALGPGDRRRWRTGSIDRIEGPEFDLLPAFAEPLPVDRDRAPARRARGQRPGPARLVPRHGRDVPGAPGPRGRGCGRRRRARLRRFPARPCRRAPRRARRRPVERTDRRRGGGRPAVDGRADRDLRAAAQRRPRGDGARHRQRRARDPRQRRRPARAVRGRRRHGGDGRGGAALRPAAASVHPHRLAGRRGVRRRPAPRRARSAACSRPRTATPRAIPIRADSTPAAAARPSSPSARASTSASARRWRDSSWRWRCRSCSSACRACGSPQPPRYADRYHFRGLERLLLRRDDAASIIHLPASVKNSLEDRG